MNRPSIAGSALLLVAVFGCAKQNAPRAPVRDAATGELPVVAAYWETSGIPMLAIWKDGSAQWYGDLAVKSEKMVGATLGADRVVALATEIEHALARFEDTDDDSRFVDFSPLTLDWSSGGSRRRVSTYHKCGPELPTLLRSRWSAIVVDGTDDPRRAVLDARIESKEHGFVQAYDQVVGAMVEELRARADPHARVRELANATR